MRAFQRVVEAGSDLGLFNGEASRTPPMPGRFVIARDGTIAHAEVTAAPLRLPWEGLVMGLLAVRR